MLHPNPLGLHTPQISRPEGPVKVELSGHTRIVTSVEDRLGVFQTDLASEAAATKASCPHCLDDAKVVGGRPHDQYLVLCLLIK